MVTSRIIFCLVESLVEAFCNRNEFFVFVPSLRAVSGDNLFGR